MVLANELEEELMFCQFWADIILAADPSQLTFPSGALISNFQQGDFLLDWIPRGVW